MSSLLYWSDSELMSDVWWVISYCGHLTDINSFSSQLVLARKACLDAQVLRYLSVGIKHCWGLVTFRLKTYLGSGNSCWRLVLNRTWSLVSWMKVMCVTLCTLCIWMRCQGPWENLYFWRGERKKGLERSDRSDMLVPDQSSHSAWCRQEGGAGDNNNMTVTFSLFPPFSTNMIPLSLHLPCLQLNPKMGSVILVSSYHTDVHVLFFPISYVFISYLML